MPIFFFTCSHLTFPNAVPSVHSNNRHRFASKVEKAFSLLRINTQESHIILLLPEMMGEGGLLNYPAACQEKVTAVLWHHFWDVLLSPIFIYSLSWLQDLLKCITWCQTAGMSLQHTLHQAVIRFPFWSYVQWRRLFPICGIFVVYFCGLWLCKHTVCLTDTFGQAQSFKKIQSRNLCTVCEKECVCVSLCVEWGFPCWGL